MAKSMKYKATDKMVDLIGDNYSLLQVMSRFGLPLGFGDRNVREVCEMNGVDCPTFLAIANFAAEGYSRMDEGGGELSIPSLVNYLRRSHVYYLDSCLPNIRRKLVYISRISEDDVSFLILKFFNEYMQEVGKHMEYEEKTVFKYVDKLVEGKRSKRYQITTFSKHHDSISEKLTELKKMLIQYYPGTPNSRLLKATLFEIYACEAGLDSHCKIEDYLFVPAILKLEKKLMQDEK